MANNDTPPSAAGAPESSGATARLDDIVSVNERGRRKGTQAGPFLMLSLVALVVLIGLLLFVNVLKARFSGPKSQPAATSTTPAGLARTFNTDAAPPLPGATPASSVASNTVAACPDGTAGNELKGQDGVVVRNASGQAVRVCANGQVAGVAPAPESARPIPVVASSRSSSPRADYGGGAAPVRPADGPMMLTGAHLTPASLIPDLTNPQAILAAAQDAMSAPASPRTEGLLTAPAPGSLEAQLTPSRTPMVQAARLTNLSLLLPKGRTIDCGMSMRIISTLAGQASCILTQNVYSADGKVVLLERGSEAVGEYRSGVSIGQKRLFVLWTRIITPAGVVINLDSPGADALGSTGLTGKVDNHWFERVGSAFLLSTIQDAIAYEVAAQQATGGGSTFVLGNTAQATDSMAQKVLDSTINIPPTIYKNQGDRAVIYVARDLDFSNVYRLRAR